MGSFDLATWLNLKGSPFEALPLFVTSLAIGLLMGVERERKHHTLAGIRTFPLTAIFGTLAAMLDAPAHGVLLQAIGLLAVASFGFLPERCADSDKTEPRTTTVASLLVIYCLGALIWHGYGGVAVAVGIVATALLYLKPELSGLTHKLERRDLLSLLQFAALSFIVLPLLPNRTFGPYQAVNPHQVWLMVTLIVGISLSGYLAVKLLGQRVGGPLLGILGGLVSSTATSLIYAREARANPLSLNLGTAVILLANLVLFVRLMVLAAVVQTSVLPAAAWVLLPGLLCGLSAALWQLRQHNNGQPQPELQLSNPSEMKLALGFGAMFALVMFCAAWLNAEFGSKGVYVVALISGLNDVDAISLTAFNLFGENRLDGQQVATTLVLAITANNVFKFSLIASLGGSALARRCLPTLLAASGGMLAGLLVLGWRT
ncbi:MgtC/SapB family protein [Aquitalea sp. USM4]|uniref:MgtC/SapB family protein n=1 Tax=Aquitalea sp. USM4 TaxID=1590041 RepID=UPI00103E8FA7|nr:MgtC/SapB family protein [Aquitalea sp. USM4]QBJ79089.1 magnesium transporter MgtC [Aquitalea sp. USM4]